MRNILENPTSFTALDGVRRIFIFGHGEEACGLHLLLAGHFKTRFLGFFSAATTRSRDPASGYLIRPLSEHLQDLGEGDYLFLFDRAANLERELGARGVRLGFPYNLLNIYRSHEGPVFQLFLDRHLRWGQDNGVGLDVGANFGQTATSMAPYFSQVHALEPNREIFANLLANPTFPANIQFHPLALGAENGQAQFYDDQGANGSLIPAAHKPHYLVDVESLDSFCERLALRPSFIKIDAEGMDARIILGGRTLIESCRPLLFFENPAANPVAGDPWPEAREFLSRHYTLHAYQCLNKLFDIDGLGADLDDFNRRSSLQPINIAAVPRQDVAN